MKNFLFFILRNRNNGRPSRRSLFTSTEAGSGTLRVKTLQSVFTVVLHNPDNDWTALIIIISLLWGDSPGCRLGVWSANTTSSVLTLTDDLKLCFCTSSHSCRFTLRTLAVYCSDTSVTFQSEKPDPLKRRSSSRPTTWKHWTSTHKQTYQRFSIYRSCDAPPKYTKISVHVCI